MSVKGSAVRGKTLVYRIPYEGELRLTNLTEEEAKETVKELGKPDRVYYSKPRSSK